MNDTSLKDNNRISVVVGVTGHREIREQDRAAIAASVRAELEKLRSLCPHSSLVMLNSLAEGGDLLCADVAEELGIPLIAALPRERKDYEQDFGVEALERFSHHCARASQVFTAPATEAIPAEGASRNYQFRQAFTLPLIVTYSWLCGTVRRVRQAPVEQLRLWTLPCTEATSRSPAWCCARRATRP